MRIGIYSGTFDPIHEGHVLFVEVSAIQFGLEKVLIIPESKPRYKDSVEDVEHRRRMAGLATTDCVETDIDIIDVDDEPSHTFNGIIAKVHDLYPDDEYFVMMGSDVFRHIGSWGGRKDEDGTVVDVADKIGFIVGIKSIKEVPELKEIAEGLSVNARFMEAPAAGLSSRKIRERIALGDEDDEAVYGLDDNVARYIELEKLYR